MSTHTGVWLVVCLLTLVIVSYTYVGLCGWSTEWPHSKSERTGTCTQSKAPATEPSCARAHLSPSATVPYSSASASASTSQYQGEYESSEGGGEYESSEGEPGVSIVKERERVSVNLMREVSVTLGRVRVSMNLVREVSVSLGRVSVNLVRVIQVRV